MKNFISLIIFLGSLFGLTEIEGRWHLVGYEDNVMYQFENNLRYSIYSIDGAFGGLDEAGGSPNPYTIEGDVITINLFFGTIVSYQMNYRCGGQVVELKTIPEEIIHSTLFREGYIYNNNSCESFGDINSDGQTNVIDAVLLVSYILEGSIVDNGDMNQDGSLNVLDVVLLVDIILNQRSR